MSAIKSLLPEAEFAVMKVIWNNPSPITTKSILSLANQILGKNWNLSTLQTLLTRLLSRGYLFSDKIGKERLYSPKISLLQYQRYELSNFAFKYDSSFFNVITALVESNGITPDELDSLRILLLHEEEGNE